LRRKPGSGPVPPPRPARAPARRNAALAAAGLALALLIAWLARPHPAQKLDALAALSSHVMADSARAAVATHRWDRALEWNAALAAREPRNSSLILGLGAACNNLTWSENRIGRSETRTARDRIGLQMLAIALMDSAAALARDEGEWVRAREMKAEAYENVGFPLDALALYSDLLRRSPEFTPARTRATWVMNHLRTPAGMPASK